LAVTQLEEELIDEDNDLEYVFKKGKKGKDDEDEESSEEETVAAKGKKPAKGGKKKRVELEFEEDNREAEMEEDYLRN
jgi:hypothetical protein